MSPSFDYLKRFDVAAEPIPYVLFQIDGEPTLFLSPAGEKNRPYHNALLKRNAKLAQRFRAGTKITREMLKENREHDRELYGKYVVTGWEGVEDGDGVDVSFTPEVCRQFLRALPDWIFDDIRQFAVNPANFLAVDEPDENDEAAVSGN